jgi:hypothetical protein
LASRACEGFSQQAVQQTHLPHFHRADSINPIQQLTQLARQWLLQSLQGTRLQIQARSLCFQSARLHSFPA